MSPPCPCVFPRRKVEFVRNCRCHGRGGDHYNLTVGADSAAETMHLCQAKTWSVSFSVLSLLSLLLLLAAAPSVHGGPEEEDGDNGQRCDIPTLKNGRVKVQNGGFTISFRCRRRHRLMDASTHARLSRKEAVCWQGQWHPPDLPVCRKMGRCAVPRKPQNGFLEFLDGTGRPGVRFGCFAGYELVGDSLIWCDGYFWNGTTPDCRIETTRSPQALLSCPFQDNLCGWSQVQNGTTEDQNEGYRDTLDWALSSQRALDRDPWTPGTGPSNLADPFLYMETSGTSLYDRAILLSPVFAGNYSKPDSACLFIQYCMNGVSVGELRIHQEPLVPNHPDKEDWRRHKNRQTLVSVSGDQGADWHWLTIWLAPMEHTLYDNGFMFVIEGVAGGTYLGDIALKNFSLLRSREACLNRGAVVHGEIRQSRTGASLLSPSSCHGRCFVNRSQVLSEHQWTEGLCDCSAECVVYPDSPTPCCSDYVEECHYKLNELNATASFFDFFRELDEDAWDAVVIGAVTIAGLLLAIATVCTAAVVCGRKRPGRRQGRRSYDQDSLEEDSDMRYMVGGDETADMECYIDDTSSVRLDFRLATPAAPAAVAFARGVKETGEADGTDLAGKEADLNAGKRSIVRPGRISTI